MKAQRIGKQRQVAHSLWRSRWRGTVLMVGLGIPAAATILVQAKGWIMAFFILGVLILGHELGHFVAAKLIGVKVEVFSIGLGPKMLKLFQIGETEYVVSWFFLFGGYVRMAGGDLGEESTGGEDEFLAKPAWQRVLVFAAGPGSNFILALVLYAALFMVGSYEPVNLQMTMVGQVDENSPAARGGLQTDDRVLSVDGKKVGTWQELQYAILESHATELGMEVDRFGERRSLVIPREETSRIEGRRIGILPSDRVIVGRVREDSPADAAGLKERDIVLAANEEEVFTYDDLKQRVEEVGAGGELSLSVYRDGERLQMSLCPELYAYEDEEPRPLIGIEWACYTKLGFGKAWAEGAKEVKNTSLQFFRVLKQLLTRSLSPKSLSGPLSVVKMTKDVAQETGLGGLLQFAAFISVNLAMINLMPLVITDGGLIFLALMEAVRRKPLSERARERYAQFGVAFLILLMALAFANDIVNMVNREEQEESAQVEEVQE